MRYPAAKLANGIILEIARVWEEPDRCAVGLSVLLKAGYDLRRQRETLSRSGFRIDERIDSPRTLWRIWMDLPGSITQAKMDRAFRKGIKVLEELVLDKEVDKH